jgi:hypothetical protein
MFLHKKRLLGSSNGIGYINPYAMNRLSIIQQQPITHGDYVKNLVLVNQKDEYQQQIGNGSYGSGHYGSGNYGSGNNRGQGGSGIDPLTAIAAVQTIYQGLKKASQFYSSETGTQLKNFYGKHINPHPNWRSGFVGEKHAIHSSGNSYNFLGKYHDMGPCLCSKA